jgi:hypothetical protein
MFCDQKSSHPLQHLALGTFLQARYNLINLRANCSSKIWTACSSQCWLPPQDWRLRNAHAAWILKVLGTWDGVEDALLSHLSYKRDGCSSLPTFELMQDFGNIQWRTISELFNSPPLLIIELSLRFPLGKWEVDNLFGSVGKHWGTPSWSFSCDWSFWSLVVEKFWEYFFKLSVYWSFTWEMTLQESIGHCFNK